MSATRQQMLDDFNTDLGVDPDADRGVALKEPVILETEKPAAQDETEEVKEVAEGPEDEPEEVSEEVEETIEASEAEGPQKLRAKDFADQAGWSLEEFYRDVTVPTDEGEATLSEVVDGYKSLRVENETLRQERQDLEANASQAPQPMQEYAPEAVQLMQQAQNLHSQYNALLDDGTLDNMDPGEATQLERKYRRETERCIQAAQEKQAEYKVQRDTQMREITQRIDKRIREDIPEWRSDEVRKQETEGMSAYLMAEGAERDTVNQILNYNPWAARMLRKLWMYEKKLSDTKKAVKRVQKIPKTLQPGAHQQAKKQTIKDVGKKLSNAKSRREWDKTLMTSEFDDALLK